MTPVSNKSIKRTMFLVTLNSKRNMMRTEVDKMTRKMVFPHLLPKDKVFIMVHIVRNRKQSGRTIDKESCRTIKLIILTTRKPLVQRWILNLTSTKKCNGTEHIKSCLNSK